MARWAIYFVNVILALNGFILWAVGSVTITGKTSFDLLSGCSAFLFYAITCVGANYLLFRHAEVKARNGAFTFSLFMVGAVAFFICITHIL